MLATTTPGLAERAGLAEDRRERIRLVAVDTDRPFMQVLRNRLDRAGWQYHVLDHPPAPEQLIPLRAHAIVLDVTAFGQVGWSALATLHSALPELGIVVVSAGATVADRVKGLRAGADDWVAKPCHPEEVLARVEAVVRRTSRRAATAIPVLEAGELSIRSDQFQAFVGERSAELTRREFELLALLAGAEGRVLEREDIYAQVWGYAMARGDRSVDVFVRKLRRKLADVSTDWSYIHTHFGVGYRFAAEPAAAAADSKLPAA